MINKILFKVVPEVIRLSKFYFANLNNSDKKNK